MDSKTEQVKSPAEIRSQAPLSLTMQLTTTSLPFRIISHNIRYATPSPFKGEEPWPHRLPHFIAQLKFLISSSPHTPSIICLQEVLHNQLIDILTALNDNVPAEQEWASIGVHRDDGNFRGEASPVIYQPSVLTPLTQNTTWLSPTPDKPSKGWDAASIRIVTHGVFQYIPARKNIVLMSTHLDDQGSESRYHAAGMILDIISDYRKDDSLPVVLAGDFNSEETQEAYKRMAAADSGVLDVKGLVGKYGSYGETNTYTGFGYEGEHEKRIDFIFVNSSKEGKNDWKVNGYSVMPNRFQDAGIFISDHRAVVADLEVVF